MFFFFNDTATTEIYTLSLHDALPISFVKKEGEPYVRSQSFSMLEARISQPIPAKNRSEEHTSELQSRLHLVCRLLLEKKKETGTGCGVTFLPTSPRVIECGSF